ncbi:hypothetical protein [Paracoccus sp. SSK6]|uniref:hypothetical protein n=1 Tax=Paracoccus sp. SSK6 TaxID=3143131 RepID=UPI00321C1115
MAHTWTRSELQQLLDLRREHKTLTQCAASLDRTLQDVAGVLGTADLSDVIHPEARVRDCKRCGDLMLSSNFGHRHCAWCRRSMNERTMVTIFSHAQVPAKKRGAA